MGDLTLLLPELLVLVAAFAAFALSAFGASYKTNWSVTLLLAAGALAAAGYSLGAVGDPLFPGIYRVDAFSQVLKLGLTLGLVLTLLGSASVPTVRETARPDLPIFLALSTAGMMMLVSATELLTLYVALELSAYALYAMVALHRDQRLGSEAAAKYLLFGAAASAMTLYGLSLLFGATGSTYLADIVAAAPTPLYTLGVLLALAGIFYKLALLPFHAWAPDTYQGAPHQVAMFIGTTSKVAAIGILVRVVALAIGDGASGPGGSLRAVLITLSVVSMTWGNLAALAQRDLKRILAYSTIAHAGYVLMGVLTLSELGLASGIFYALIYLLVAFAAFLAVSAVGQDGSNPTLESLGGLFSRAPVLMAALLVGLFGLAGIPPTPGFAGKWFIFSAAMDAGLFWLVFIGAVNATISLYYYLRMVKYAVLKPQADAGASVSSQVPVSGSVRAASYLVMALVVAAGFFPGPLWDLAQAASKAVLG